MRSVFYGRATSFNNAESDLFVGTHAEYDIIDAQTISGDRMKPITPIRTEREYAAALAEVDKLWDAKPNTPAADRLEVLTTLVEAYEAAHWPVDPPDPIDAILFRMEQQGLTRRDLEPYLGGGGTCPKC